MKIKKQHKSYVVYTHRYRSSLFIYDESVEQFKLLFTDDTPSLKLGSKFFRDNRFSKAMKNKASDFIREVNKIRCEQSQVV